MIRPWALAGLLALGCGDPEPASPANPAGGCTDDDGCPTDTRCVLGGCVGSSPPTYSVALRLRPRADQILAAVEVEGIDFAPTEPVLSLLNPLPVPDRLELAVRLADASGRIVPARAIARPNRGVGAPVQIGAEPLNDPVAPGFMLPLAPWWPTPIGGARQINYALRVAPEGLPPWRLDVLQVDPQQTSQRFALPGDASDLATISGQVRVSASNPTPLRDLRVDAVDEAGRLVSTTAFTDATGQFTLSLWPDEVARAVTVRVLSTDEGRPLPALSTQITVPAGGDPPPLLIEVGEVARTFTVTGQLGDPDRPVAGATVHLSAPVGNGTHQTTVYADDDGRFEATVYGTEAEYLIDIEPPLDTPYRLTRRSARLSLGRPVVIEPLTRSQVFGRVVDVSGRPVPGATVSATLLEARYGDPRLIQPGETPPSRPVLTATSPDGSFAFALDPGRQALRIQPPASSGLPAITHVVEFAGEQARPADVGTLMVPPAAVLTLTLVDERAAPVADVAVEAWRTADDTAQASHLADATSDAEGRVVLVLPAQEALGASPNRER